MYTIALTDLGDKRFETTLVSKVLFHHDCFLYGLENDGYQHLSHNIHDKVKQRAWDVTALDPSHVSCTRR